MADMDDAAPWRVLYRYWLDKHADGRMPGRGDIDPPVEIPTLVKDMMLVAVGPDGFRYRLIGSSVAAFIKRDMTGRKVAVSEWMPQSVRSDWLRLLEAVSASRAPQLVIAKFPAAVKAYTHCLVLPLIGADGRTEQLLIGIFHGGYIEPGTPIEGLTTREVTPPADYVSKI
jgi:hypothetical protein